MSERLVFARESTTLHDAQGIPWRVVAGQPWDADDPLVRLHPSFFADRPEPGHVGRTLTGEGLSERLRVEQATREPGEARPLRRELRRGA